MKDFSNQKIRCSSIGAIMTNQQGKKDTKTIEELSETAKKELIKIYVLEVYGREKEFSTKYTEKGIAVEEDALTLVSRIKHLPLMKNSTRFENDFISGEPDTINPLFDMKACWDIHTFYDHKTSKLKPVYEWQMRGYCDLLGKDSGTVAFCLIDTPQGQIEQEKKNLYWRMNVATMENPEYLAACEQLEKEMTFGDVPLEERLHEVLVKRNPEEMQRVYDRIALCREWLNEFANKSVLV